MTLNSDTEDERLRRWRLILGGEQADGTGYALSNEDREIDRRVRAAEDLEGDLRALGADHPVTLALEDELQRPTNVLLVVDDEDRLRGGPGVGCRFTHRRER